MAMWSSDGMANTATTSLAIKIKEWKGALMVAKKNERSVQRECKLFSHWR
jgi:hypothetical protein